MVGYYYPDYLCSYTFSGKKMAGELVHDYILAIILDLKTVKDQRRLNHDCVYRPTRLSCNDSVQ